MSSFKKVFKDWIIPIIAAIIISALIKKFLFFNIAVPTGSMYPTIKPGDRILVTRIYNKEKIKRGDVLVFFHEESNDNLIKRVVGLPKEKVEVNQEGTYVNDKKLDETYVVNKGGADGSFVVPEKSYLFLGDNRSNSNDSRYWQKTSYISQDEIKGKAQFIIYPFNRIGRLK